MGLRALWDKLGHPSRHAAPRATRRTPFGQARPLRLEPLEDRRLLSVDFGDAPDPGYPTLLAHDGARHTIVSGGPILGSAIDEEIDGQPTAGADGDDLNGAVPGDEDGVTFGSIMVGQLDAQVTVQVTGGPAKLDAWIDFNADGSWGGPGEHIFDSVDVVTGDNHLTFDAPSWAADGPTYARFRLSTAGGLGHGGPAADGEVEDYQVTIDSPAAADGLFVDRGQPLGGSPCWTVSLGDLDGDGDLDAFTANYGQPNAVWFNDGSGSFTDSGQLLGNSDSRGSVLGDVDGDGDLDAVVANDNDQPTEVWLNNGAGTFTDSGQDLAGGSSRAVALGDLDGDGDLDAVVPSRTDHTNKIWLNDGAGLFFDSGRTLGVFSSFGISLGDLDGDGDLDALADHPGVMKVWLNDGTGTFIENGQDLRSTTPWGISLGDLDADGDLDAFVLARAGGPSEVWWNDGTGTLVDSGQRMGDSDSHGVALGDLDGDGDLDAYVANLGRPNKVWLNNGAGVFTDSGQDLGNLGSADVNLGDVDGDGDLDAAVANWNQGNRLWLNVPFDFGDAPDPFTAAGQYPTLLPGGARHAIFPGYHLGETVDSEPDGQPNATATGDDGDENNDDDGVVPAGPSYQGVPRPVRVTATAEGFLDAWVDWDQDGIFEAGEQVATAVPLASGPNFINVEAPPAALLGSTFARFRFSSVGNLAPDGPAPDGEVEDYQVEVLSGPALVVDTLADESDGDFGPGDFSLREAIQTVNAGPGPDTIVFDPALFDGSMKTIMLALGEIPITQAVLIIGPGRDDLTVDADYASRIFNIDDGDGGTQVAVVLSDMTLTRGEAPFPQDGGAIYSVEDLTLSEAAITDSRTPDGNTDDNCRGGAIFSDGNLAVIDSMLTGNRTGNGADGKYDGEAGHDGGDGGAVYALGTATITRSTLSGNRTGYGGVGDSGVGTYHAPSGRGGSGGAVYCDGSLTIENSSLTENTAVGRWPTGGGVRLVGSLVMTATTVSGNATGSGGFGGWGGGLYVRGTIDIADCTITDNETGDGANGYGDPFFGNGELGEDGGPGAGLYLPDTTGTIARTTISGNTAGNAGDLAAENGGLGGGLFVIDSPGLLILDSTISGNTAGDSGAAPFGPGGGRGGGLYLADSTVTILRSTISGNTAGNTAPDGSGYPGFGAGIYNDGTLTVLNSTISGNTAGVNQVTGSRADGGGIFNNASLTIHNSTLTDNTAESGGGLYSESSASTVLHNTIVAGNHQDPNPEPDDVYGPVDPASSYNVIGVDTDMTGISDGSGGNQVGTAADPLDPMLGPLDDNGGPTLTHALLDGSPALESGDPAFDPAAFDPPMDDDQRGAPYNRVYGARIDVGAFEKQSTTVDFLDWPGLDPSGEDLWYEVETSQAGYLTVRADYDPAGGGASFELYDSQQNPLASSATGSGLERLDQSAAGAGEVYFVKLAGPNSSVRLRLCNLVERNGTTVNVAGTAGADHYQLLPDADYQVAVNGIDYHFTAAEMTSAAFAGGEGDDLYELALVGMPVDIDDAGGTDTLDFSAATQGVNVNLATAGPQTVAPGNTLTLAGTVENLVGSGFDDVLYGNDAANWLFGGGGADLLVGQNGDDLLDGGNGDDVAIGGFGDDTLYGQDGDDRLFGRWGNDFLVGHYGNDALRGEEGNDYILGAAGDDSIFGEAGNDLIRGQGWDDLVHGGSGNDTIFGNAGNDLLFGNGGNDVIRGGTEGDFIRGCFGNDIVLGEEGDDRIYGGFNRDLVIGGVGADVVDGEGLEDILIGGTTDHDASDAALLAILFEWRQSTPIDDRIDHLTGTVPGGQNVPYFLSASELHDDAQPDTLTGGTGQDWFAADGADVFSDQTGIDR